MSDIQKEQLMQELEAQYGANWFDSTDQYERGA